MTLHPQSKEFLAALAAQHRPGWNEMQPTEAQAGFAALMHLFGEGPELRRVEDLTTDTGTPLRIYHANPDGMAPVMMYFHGGGWVLGDIETHDALCRKLAAESECAVVSVHYRRAPEHPYPAAFDDCYLATRYVAENAGQLGVNGKQIVVAGDSAGGNLAATVALKARDFGGPSIAGQVLLYPVISRNFETESYIKFAEGFGLSKEVMAWFWQQYLGSSEPDAYCDPSLADSLDGLPPAYVVIAGYDVLRSEGERYAKLLGEAGNKVTVEHYAGALHGFMHLFGTFDDGRKALTDMAKAVRKFVHES